MDMQQVVTNVDVTQMERKFIKVYEQLSNLWNPKHPDYNNRHKRNASYDALLQVYRKYMPKATRLHVRKKINIIRSCYRKELRRYLSTKTINDEGKVVYTYVATNWKFGALRFLDGDFDANNVKYEVDDSSTVDSYPEYEDEQELEYEQAVETESGNEEPDTSKIDITPLYVEEEEEEVEKPKPKRKRTRNMTNQSFTSDSEGLEKEYNAVGANVACKLQRMNPYQRYHAELLINKVLIKGLKDQLNEDTDLIDSWTVEQVSVNYNTSKGDSDGLNEQ